MCRVRWFIVLPVSWDVNLEVALLEESEEHVMKGHM